MDSASNDQIKFHSQLTIDDFSNSFDTKLSWKRPVFKGDPWVFWSHEQPQTLSSFSSSASPSSSSIAAESSLANKQRITELYNFPLWGERDLLIQFWAATKSDGLGGCILTTRDQPFVLSKLDTGFLEYRKLLLTYTFQVDADEEQLRGLPGRVFRNKWPESIPKVSDYSTVDYPQRDFALRCGIRSSLALPVFQSSGCDLLGVLELVTRTDDGVSYFGYQLEKITNSKVVYPNILELASKEIQRVLEKVCDLHQLPLAQSWVLGNYSNTPAYDETQENRDAMVVTNYAVPGECKWNNFFKACLVLRLKKDQGIVGKALLSHKPCFCKDITQFSMTDYPLVHYTREYFGAVGCFTICLRNFITGNRDYVMEFFLPPLEDPATLLNGLLATLKEHFNTFKVASGGELGEELSVQVVKSSIHDESHSFKICQTEDDYYPSCYYDRHSDEYYTIYSFKEYMQTRLSCGPRKLNKWVFLTEDDDYPHIPTQSLSSSSFGKHAEVIQKIAFALTNYDFWFYEDYLIQFWAPITYEGRCILKTSGQPFALNRLHRGLCAYRKDSLSYQFLVEENGRVEEDQLGIIGRVFRNKWPESTPHVHYYTEKEHPRRDDALHHGVAGSIAIPVFDSSGWCCVGVLEIVSTRDNVFEFEIESFDKAYKVITEITDLKIPPWIAPKKEMNVTEGLEPALNEINRVLKVICERHLLPLVHCWVRWSFSRALFCGGMRNFLALTSAEGTPMFKFDDITVFRKVQGLVGKTLLSHKSCFCRDITQLSLNEYPFLNHARHLELTQCFTICLRNTSTGDEDYVLEFFLPPCNNEEPEDPQILLDSLLATMKENFQSFKVASGEELGEELRVEVYKLLNDNEDESFRICQPKRYLSQPESLENEGEMMAPDPSDQQLVMEDAIHQDPNVFGAKIGDTTCINETSVTEHVKTVKDFSKEDIVQHFGRPLDDAADSLNVSRSTFKRLCRKFGIPRWQSHKRTSKRQRVGEEPSRRELSCSDMPHMQSTSTVAHTSQDVYPVAVKAKYKDDIIKFELASSSGMAELEEIVTQRLHLEKGNFRIKYEDEEGDWVLIACDNDLKTCIMDIWRSSNKTAIKMSIY